jgi:hypothetical protein
MYYATPAFEMETGREGFVEIFTRYIQTDK